MKNWKIYLLIGIVLLFLGASGYFGFQSIPTEVAIEPLAPVTVEVTRGDINQSILTPGRLMWTDMTHVPFKDSGQITEIMVRPGDWVEKGQILLLIDNQSENQDEFEIIEILAPRDGVVLVITKMRGDLVTPGGVAVKLTNPTSLEVVATVIEEDLPYLEVEQSVELFFDARPELIIESQVVRILPESIPGDRPLYKVFISLDEVPQGFASGMTADASIIIDARTNVLQLPRSLVRIRPDGSAMVSIWINGQAVERLIQTGLRGDLYIEILEGLEVGDQVIGK
jgi:multidrug efflux pump subunit AcrA (membrane-fusion protein)